MAEPKDKWDKAEILLKPVGGLVTALTITIIGLISSHYLNTRQDKEMRVRLHAELMSKREASDVELRREMFDLVIKSFIEGIPQPSELETEVLNLELLGYNFHESFDISPLFKHIDLKLRKPDVSNTDRKEFRKRLEKVASEIRYKQLAALESVGEKFDKDIFFDDSGKVKQIELEKKALQLDELLRSFTIRVLNVDVENHELEMEVEIVTIGEEESKSKSVSFTLSPFDFPMIDNLHLSDDQRCAVVLKEFESEFNHAGITLILFPGSYASLKEKPFYQAVIDQLMEEKEDLKKDQK